MSDSIRETHSHAWYGLVWKSTLLSHFHDLTFNECEIGLIDRIIFDGTRNEIGFNQLVLDRVWNINYQSVFHELFPRDVTVTIDKIKHHV